MSPDALLAHRDAIAAAIADEPDPDLARYRHLSAYIPASIAAAQAHADRVDVLILTVGRDAWSVPVSVALHPARQLVALVDHAAEPALKRALALADVRADRVDVHPVPRRDALAAYQTLHDATADTLTAPRVVVDLTSGPRALVLAIAAAAAHLGLERHHVHAERLGPHPLRGYERWGRAPHPVEVWGHRDRADAERAVARGEPTRARLLFEGLARGGTPSDADRARARLCAGLEAADRLEFGDAAMAVHQAAAALHRRAPSAHQGLRALGDALHELDGAASARGAPQRHADRFHLLLRFLVARARNASPDVRDLMHRRALGLVLRRRLWWSAADVTGADLDLPGVLALLDAAGDPVRTALRDAWPAERLVDAIRRTDLRWSGGRAAARRSQLGRAALDHAREACDTEGLPLPDPDPLLELWREAL